MLLQVWTLKAREEGTHGSSGLFVLPCVERHWRIATVKHKLEEVSGGAKKHAVLFSNYRVS